MAHHLDRPIATEFSHQALQTRRLRGEDGPCALDSTNRRLYGVPSLIVNRRAFIADVDEFGDTATPVNDFGDAANVGGR